MAANDLQVQIGLGLLFFGKNYVQNGQKIIGDMRVHTFQINLFMFMNHKTDTIHWIVKYQQKNIGTVKWKRSI